MCKKRCLLQEDIIKNFIVDSVFLYPNLGKEIKRGFRKEINLIIFLYFEKGGFLEDAWYVLESLVQAMLKLNVRVVV